MEPLHARSPRGRLPRGRGATATLAALVLTVAVLAILHFALGSSGESPRGVTPTAPATEPAAAPETSTRVALAPEFGADQLFEPPAKGWVTNGGAITNQRYSPLNEINTGDVDDLRGVWMARLGKTASGFSAESQPLEYEGTLYVSTGSDQVFAVDVTTGKVLWHYDPHLPARMRSRCCEATNRGVAIGDGMVYVAQLNGKLVALNQRTGVTEWIAEVARASTSYSLMAAPLYYKGRVYTGPAAGAHGMRGYLAAYDASTGELDWRFYTIPAPGEPGHETWPSSGPGADAWEEGGGAIWSTPAVDPKLDMLYLSAGPPGPTDGRLRPGDDLYSDSILALDPETGHLDWSYQEVHHDVWGYGATSPVVLFDASVDGQNREAIAQAGRNGFLYVLDRRTGKPIVPAPERYVGQDPQQLTVARQPFSALTFTPQTVTSQALAQLRAEIAAEDGPAQTKVQPTGIYEGATQRGSVAPAIAPSYEGGDSWAPGSFDPWTDDYYVCAQSGAEALPPMRRQGTGKANAGGRGSGRGKGADVLPAAITTGADAPGTLTALSMSGEKVAWQEHFPDSCFSGVVSTAGNLVFVGRNDGRLEAFNAIDGTRLWSFQTGAGANSTVTPFEFEGREYLAFYAGGNAEAGSASGSNLWLFSLEGKLGPVRPPLSP